MYSGPWPEIMSMHSNYYDYYQSLAADKDQSESCQESRELRGVGFIFITWMKLNRSGEA